MVSNANPVERITLVELTDPTATLLPSGEAQHGTEGRKFLGRYRLRTERVTLDQLLTDQGRLQDGDLVAFVPSIQAADFLVDRFLQREDGRFYRIVFVDDSLPSGFVEVIGRCSIPGVSP
jgi:hypothetical protein